MSELSHPYRIAIADDDAFMREFIADTLQPEFAVQTYEFGRGLLEGVHAEPPDIILLDLEMEDLDGIDVCLRLKADTSLADIPVVFVSGHDEPEQRVLAYQAGAEDYVVKPVSAAELRAKVQVVARLIEGRRALQAQSAQAQQVAFAAMTSMGEIGAVMDFMRSTFGCRNADDLLDRIGGYYAQCGLSGGAQLRGDDGQHSQLFGGAAPLTETALRGIGHLGRIAEFSNRLAINYPRCSLLISNLPLDDPERCGRIRDNFALVAEAADIRLEALDAAHRLAGIGHEVAAAAQLAQDVAGRYVREARHYHQDVTMLLDGQAVALERAFVHLGLTEGQETALVDIVRDTGQKVLDAAAPLQSFEREFTTVVDRLAGIDRIGVTRSTA